MSDDDELRRLRSENEELARRLADALRANERLAQVGRNRPPAVFAGILNSARDELESQRLLRAVFESALDAILLIDRDGRVLDANPAGCHLFGTTCEALRGRTVAELASGTAFRTGTRAEGELEVVRGDGTSRQVEYAAVADILPGVSLAVLRDVTERRAMRDALDEAQAHLRTVVAHAPLILFALDERGTYTVHQGKGVEAVGLRPGELVGRSAFVDEEVWGGGEGAVARALAGEEVHVEVQAGPIIFDCTLVPMRDAGGRVAGVTGVAVDVSARKRAESALRASEARFRAMIEKSQDGISLLDADARTIYQSPAVERLFGYAPHDASRIAWQEFVPPEDVPLLGSALSHLLAQPSSSITTEFQMRHRDGTLRRIELSATNLLHDPDVGALVTNFRDVTERHAINDELRMSEQRYRRIVESTSEGVVTTDVDARITFANRRFAELLGYTPEELVGMSGFRLVDADEGRSAAHRIDMLREGPSATYERRYRRKDGTPLWTRVSATPLRDASGRYEGTLALVSDVTPERSASEMRQRLAAIVEQSQDAIVSTDRDGVVTTWNGAAERLSGYAASEMIGRSSAIVIPDDRLDDARARLGAVLDGHAIESYDTRWRRKDGGAVEVALSISPVRGPDGHVVGTSIVARDLTEARKAETSLRRTEDQLRQAQKLEAIAALAGGIAHDFNNLLTVVLTCASLVIAELPEGHPLRAEMEGILSAGTRASELTRQLLAFGRQQVLKPRVLDLREVVLGVKPMLGRILREDVELVLVTRGPSAKVFADRGQLEQIVLNLVVNARDAMPDGGRLTITTSNAELDATFAEEHPGVRPGRYVMLSVSDTGVGMDAATRERIFEPFFTTKERGAGSGLGLSTVFGIVRQSTGHIEVESEPGKGSTFMIYLPVSEREETAPGERPAPVVLRGSETVLVVEDEDQVRRSIRSVLRKQGYEVLEASNGRDAIVLCEQSETPIHLLVTDIVMPKMSGRELAERLAERRPNLRVLFVSGYTDDAPALQGVLGDGAFFLQKPLTPSSLGRKVREALDAPSTRAPPASGR